MEDGNFLRRVHQLREAATEQLKAAKCAETSNISEDTRFELYQEAYNQFADIDQILEEARKHDDFLKHKASMKSIGSAVSLVVGLASLGLALLTLVF